MGEFSLWHWLLVIVIAFLLFGTNKLGAVGKGLAEGIRNFAADLVKLEGYVQKRMHEAVTA